MKSIKALTQRMLALGFALTGAACASMPEASSTMALGGPATAPRGFVQFCERQLADCGASAEELADMRAAAKRSASATAAIAFDWTPYLGQFRQPTPKPAVAPRQVGPVTYDWSGVFARAGITVTPIPAAGSQPAPTRVTLDNKTWSLLTHTNDAVNRAIVQRNDIDIYGVEEVWATPLESGGRFGDCEDYVLEKRRALIAAGLPASALSIAVVQTTRGESHAVLLVATDKGEYALDSLNAWVMPWAKAGYLWRERQVEGSASRWAFAAGPTAPEQSSLLLAALR